MIGAGTEAETTATQPAVSGWQRMRDLAAKPWFAYLTLVLLQLKVVWQAWEYRDLTAGDTAGYHMQAWQWHADRYMHFVWSPLYTVFYGTVLDAVPDPVAGTMLHRMIIIFAASTLVLALFRRLVSPGIAWLTAAWWAVLPINFNTMYEVHLFALLPTLAAWLAVAAYRNVWARGGALAVFAASTLLVRNEMVVPTGLWGLACLAYEFRAWRRSSATAARRLAKLTVAYGLPLALVVPAVLYLYKHSTAKLHDGAMQREMRIKHTLNMAQVYCFGYQQRHPEWTASPWVEYQQLMTEKFGTDMPSFREMIAANPGAVAEHVAWNYSLLPNGLQLMLFNATSGKQNPDYAQINAGSTRARDLTRLLLGIWAAGLVALFRDPRGWWDTCVRGRGQVWVAMLCVAAVSTVVIATQRPRPSYLFVLTVTLMGMTASFVHLLAVRTAALTHALAVLMPGVMVGLIAVVPPYFKPKDGVCRTPVRDTIRTMQPFQPLIAREGAVLVKGPCAFEVLSYIAHQKCGAVHGYEFLSNWAAPETLDAFLTRSGVTLVFLDHDLLERLRADAPDRAKVFLGSGNAEWALVGAHAVQGHEWKFFMRGQGVPAPTAIDFTSGRPPTGADPVWVHPDGWVGDRAGFSLTRLKGANRAVIRGVVPQIQDADFTTTATVLLDGREAMTRDLRTGEFELLIPITPFHGTMRVEVRFSRLQPLPGGDGRQVGARLYSAMTLN